MRDAERKAQREAEAATAHLSLRQRLGLSLSKLTQDELDNMVKTIIREAKAGDPRFVHALARLADQSFGHAREAEEAPKTSLLERQWNQWTEEERAAYRAHIVRQSTASGDSSDPRDPRGEADRA
jgi:hypothetical protein